MDHSRRPANDATELCNGKVQRNGGPPKVKVSLQSGDRLGRGLTLAERGRPTSGAGGLSPDQSVSQSGQDPLCGHRPGHAPGAATVEQAGAHCWTVSASGQEITSVDADPASLFARCPPAAITNR
jgi:hypothetical protein